MKDLAVVAKPILTFSITDAFSSFAFGSVALLGAASPANLKDVNGTPHIRRNFYILVRHDNQETFTSILVCLKLIVLGVYASPTAQKEQKLRRKVGVVARFCNVDLTLILGLGPMVLDM